MKLTKNKRNDNINPITILTMIILFLANMTLLNVIAENKEYKVEEFQEKYSVPPNNVQVLDFIFQEGKKLEIIYTIQVEEGYPIDLWFINEDNYMLLSGGAQFLYFIDGSEQKISYAKKVVTLTKHDNYKLVITNYHNNITIDVDINGEIRSFMDKDKEDSLNFLHIIIYLLVIIITLLIIITIVLGIKLHKLNKNEIITSKKESTNKNMDNKPKRRRKINKDKDSKKKIRSEKSQRIKTSSNSYGYCGYCGETVSTPFCKKCGYKV